MKMEDLEITVETRVEPVSQSSSTEQGAFARIKRATRIASSFVLPVVKQLFQCALVASLAFTSYWFFSKHVIQTVEVVGVSMTPTLHNSGHYLLDRWTYLIRDPEPNDIVVLRDPTDSRYAVKRIIGGAGDSIHLKGGHVYINGRLLDEPYLPAGTLTYAFDTKGGEQWIVCGTNQYYVLGDNRGNSEDSRIYGPISRESIVGTIIPQ